MIQNGDAIVDGPINEYRIKLTFATTEYVPARHRGKMEDKRVVKDSNPTQAIASVQDEPLYRGLREDGAPVSMTMITLRKVRGNKLVNWSDKDKFPARRFNPDNIHVARARHPQLASFQSAAVR